jgi:hypothetical protein
LPADLASAHALVIAHRAALLAAQSEVQHRALLIEKLKYTIKKLQHEQFGQSSERRVLLDQLELQLADLEEDAAQVKAAAAAETIRRRARGPLLVPVGHYPACRTTNAIDLQYRAVIRIGSWGDAAAMRFDNGARD